MCTAEVQSTDPMLLDACALEAATLVTTSSAMLNVTGLQGARLARPATRACLHNARRGACAQSRLEALRSYARRSARARVKPHTTIRGEVDGERHTHSPSHAPPNARRREPITVVCFEVVNPSLLNAVGASITNLYIATPFVGASYGIDLANVYLVSPAAMLANGIQVADVFIGSPSAGEFMGVDGYNVYIGSPSYFSKSGYDPALGGPSE